MTATKPRFSFKPLLGVCRWHSADSQASEGYRSTGLLKGSSELGNRLVDFLNRATEPVERMESLALALAGNKDRFADDVVREWLDSQESHQAPSCEDTEDEQPAPEEIPTIPDGMVQYPHDPLYRHSRYGSLSDYPIYASLIPPREGYRDAALVTISKLKDDPAKSLESLMLGLKRKADRYDNMRVNGWGHRDPNYPATAQNRLMCLDLMRNSIGAQKMEVQVLIEKHPSLAELVPDWVFPPPVEAGFEIVPMDEPDQLRAPQCDEDGVVIEEAEADLSGVIPHPVQIPGKALHALIKEFCEPFDKKGGSQPTHSVGLGSSSIVATDAKRAILLGELEASYRTTDYRRTMVEGDWSKRMDEAVRWDALPEMGQTTDIDNPVLPGIEIEGPQYPQIGSVIARHSLEGMVEIAGFDPQMLVAVGKVADSLGAVTVTLYHDGLGQMMGFRFEASPTIGSGENEVVCQPFPVQGLLCARAKGSKEKGEEGGE